LTKSPCRHKENGVATVEAVLIIPAAMTLLLFAVQACLWAHAANVVQAAASQAVVAASLNDGSTYVGTTDAKEFLAASASHVVIEPTVSSNDMSGGLIEVQIRGWAEEVVPWLRLPVSATRTALIQEFRVSG